MDAREQLIGAIKESGLSISEYARQVLARYHSTVYRWLSKEREIPQIVQRWLEQEYSQNDNQ